MGQKTSPKILRLNINQTWSSVWNTTSTLKHSYSNFLHSDFLTRDYLKVLYSKLCVTPSDALSQNSSFLPILSPSLPSLPPLLFYQHLSSLYSFRNNQLSTKLLLFHIKKLYEIRKRIFLLNQSPSKTFVSHPLSLSRSFSFRFLTPSSSFSSLLFSLNKSFLKSYWLKYSTNSNFYLLQHNHLYSKTKLFFLNSSSPSLLYSFLQPFFSFSLSPQNLSSFRYLYTLFLKFYLLHQWRYFLSLSSSYKAYRIYIFGTVIKFISTPFYFKLDKFKLLSSLESPSTSSFSSQTLFFSSPTLLSNLNILFYSRLSSLSSLFSYSYHRPESSIQRFSPISYFHSTTNPDNFYYHLSVYDSSQPAALLPSQTFSQPKLGSLLVLKSHSHLSLHLDIQTQKWHQDLDFHLNLIASGDTFDKPSSFLFFFPQKILSNYDKYSYRHYHIASLYSSSPSSFSSHFGFYLSFLRSFVPSSVVPFFSSFSSKSPLSLSFLPFPQHFLSNQALLFGQLSSYAKYTPTYPTVLSSTPLLSHSRLLFSKFSSLHRTQRIDFVIKHHYSKSYNASLFVENVSLFVIAYLKKSKGGKNKFQQLKNITSKIISLLVLKPSPVLGVSFSFSGRVYGGKKAISFKTLIGSVPFSRLTSVIDHASCMQKTRNGTWNFQTWLYLKSSSTPSLISSLK